MSVHLVGNEAPVNELVRSQNTILQILGGQPSPLTMEQQHRHHQQQMHQFHQQRQMDPRFVMDGRMMHQDGNFNDMGPKHFNNNMFMAPPPPPPNFQQQQQQQFHHQQGHPPSFMPGFRDMRMGPPPPGMMRPPPPPPNDIRFRNGPPPPGMFSDENRH